MSRTTHPRAYTTVPNTPAQVSLSEREPPDGYTQPAARLVEGNHLMRHIDRAPPGDIVRRASRSQSRPDLARQKSKRNFFDDAFSASSANLARERVLGDAIVLAEVKTNVIVCDEFAFVTELADHLSQRYQRPVSSIAVTLRHGACMFFGGSFDPAYVMSVFALPPQVQPATNKRNAALIQKHMEEALGVRQARGLLRFVPVQEEHLAWHGKTTAGKIDEMERSLHLHHGREGEAGASGSPSAVEDTAGGRPKTPAARKRLSVKSFAALKPLSAGGVPLPELGPLCSADEDAHQVSSAPPCSKESGPSLTKHKFAQRKKSFVATIFGWSGNKPSDGGTLLPSTREEE